MFEAPIEARVFIEGTVAPIRIIRYSALRNGYSTVVDSEAITVQFLCREPIDSFGALRRSARALTNSE
jgi:hypothetical protein